MCFSERVSRDQNRREEQRQTVIKTNRSTTYKMKPDDKKKDVYDDAVETCACVRARVGKWIRGKQYERI